MPMVRPVPGPRPLLTKLGHLAIQLGFANSIRPLSKTPPTTFKYPLKQVFFYFICPSHLLQSHQLGRDVQTMKCNRKGGPAWEG